MRGRLSADWLGMWSKMGKADISLFLLTGGTVMNKARIFVLVLVCLLTTSAGPALAAAIMSFSFGSSLTATEFAGAPGARMLNWNVIDASNLTLNGVKDYAGVTHSDVTVAFTLGSGSSTAFQTGSGTNDWHMFSGYRDLFNGTPATITVTDIPYATYDVYFYMHADHDGPNRTGAFTIGGTTQYMRSLQSPSGDPTDGGGYSLSTDTTQTTAAGTTEGNYVVFRGLTDPTLYASLTAGLSGDVPRNKASGFQIVGSPAPTIVETNTQGSTLYTVSSTDLLQTHATLTSATGISSIEGTDGSGAALTDGTVGPSYLAVDYINAVAIHTGAELIYTFDGGDNGAGYDITQIDTYTGWKDSGRNDQQYTVLYSTMLNPDFYIPLATVNYQTGTIATSVSLTDEAGGLLAENVARLKFDFPTTENGYVGYREFDVFGISSVPEPSALAMLLATIGLLGGMRRRRQR